MSSTPPTTGQGERNDTVVFADTLDWALNSQLLVYDQFNRVTKSSGSPIEYWDVMLIDVESEVIIPLLPPQPDGISLGNPTFGQTSDIYLVFDRLDFNTGASDIMAMNRLTGETNRIEVNGGDIGASTYSPDDSRLVFQRFDEAAETFSLRQITLAADHIRPAGASIPYITNGQLPTWFTISSGMTATK